MYQIKLKNNNEYNKFICDTSSIYFSCVLKNEAEGVVWGNHVDSPDFLLVFSQYQKGFQLMGKPIPKEEWQEFRLWFLQTIIPFMENKGLSSFEYGSDHEELAEMFRGIFNDMVISWDYQKIFEWSDTRLEISQPEGFQIKRVDRYLLQQDFKN